MQWTRRGLRIMVSVTAQANYGAILTFQKSPAPSAVRKENRVRLSTRNPAGSQYWNIFSWHGGLHMMARDCRIKNSTLSLRRSTKLYEKVLLHIPPPSCTQNESLCPLCPAVSRVSLNYTLGQSHIYPTFHPPSRLSETRWLGLLLNLLLWRSQCLGHNVLYKEAVIKCTI